MSMFKSKKTNIAIYMDSLGYFEKRNLITNALHNRIVSAPFTNAEIIEYARQEDAESWTGLNASSTSLAGYDNDVLFIGKPETNPETGEKNSLADQSGLLDKTQDAIQGNLLIIGGVLTGVFLIIRELKK